MNDSTTQPTRLLRPRRPNAAAALLIAVLTTPHAAAQLKEPDPADGSPTLAPATQPTVATPSTSTPAANSTPAASPETAAAFERFRQAQKVVRQARSITFELSNGREGGLLDHLGPTIAARARMVRPTSGAAPAGGPWVIRLTGSGTPRQGAEPVNFDVSWGDGRVEWIDHAEKKVFVRPFGRGKSDVVTMAAPQRPMPLLDADPFMRELQATSIEARGQETIEGEPCDVFVVTYEKSGTLGKFFLSTRDNLPRRIERVTENKREGTSSRNWLILTNVRVDEGLERSAGDVERAYDVDSDLTLEPRTSPATPASTTPTTAQPAPSGPVYAKAPEFTLTPALGEPITRARIAGNVTILEFFGTWSLPARKWHPRLHDIAKAYQPDNVTVYVAPVRERSPTAAAQHLDTLNLSLLRLVEGGDAAAAAFGVRVFPATVVINANGEIVKMVEGASKVEDHFKQVNAAVRTALGRSDGGGGDEGEGTKSAARPTSTAPKAAPVAASILVPGQPAPAPWEQGATQQPDGGSPLSPAKPPSDNE